MHAKRKEKRNLIQVSLQRGSYDWNQHLKDLKDLKDYDWNPDTDKKGLG